MKTADDSEKSIITAYCLCRFGNIADSRVTAASNDREVNEKTGELQLTSDLSITIIGERKVTDLRG
jgi:hypothetical protein